MFSIIIPAYNEEGRIEKTLQSYLRYLEQYHHDEYEIIVVPNGCSDRTPEIIKDFSRRFPRVRCSEIKTKSGKGGAIIEGFKIASGKIVSYVDADGATPPEALCAIVKEVASNRDGVIGSRWLTESKIIAQQSITRKIASRVFNFVVKLFFFLPYRDTQCGAKAFKKEVIDSVLDEIITANLAFDVELLYRLRKKGYKIKEVPTIWEDKQGSTVNLKKASLKMFLAIIRLRLMESPFERLVQNRLASYIYQKLEN